MKILFITRIYTAIVDSIAKKHWQPKGMPAYYKLLEALHKESDLDVDAVCLGKLAHDGIDKKDIFILPNLKINFYVIPYKPIRSLRIFGSLLCRRINAIINDVFQFLYCLNLVLRNKYDLIYVDRAHIVFGAIFAILLRKKVIVRLYGVGSLIKRMSGIKKWLKGPFVFLSYKAPFRYIICSKDGSGTGYFFGRFINKKVPYEILLNGIDEIGSNLGRDNILRSKYGIPDDRRIILFIGKLSVDKGIDLFIKALNALYKINTDFYAVIIGDGPLKEKLVYEIEKSGLTDNVKFEGQVAHNLIYKYYNAADIYISLNLLGNLSNTVLEAINAGKCIVTFGKDSPDHTDEDTEDILSGKAVLINKRNVIQELPMALNALLTDTKRMEDLAQSTRKLSIDLLKSWDDRIEYEVELLQRMANST